MKKIPVSVFIITKNEEKNIQRCLESVNFFEEIIIVDSGSVDATLQIAKYYNNVKIYHQEWLGFAKQKQFALEKCIQPWVLNLDADEEISEDAVNFIVKTINENKFDGIEFAMCNYFCNKKPHPWSANMKKIRFAKRNKVKYDTQKTVHESMQIDGKIIKTATKIYHYGENSIHTLIEKINNYSSLRTQNKKKIKFATIQGCLAFVISFIKSYIIKRNFLNGQSGFVVSFILSFYAFLKKVKTLESDV